MDREHAYKPTYELLARQREDDQRAEEGGQGRRERLPRGRPRPRGRSDLLAPAGGAQAGRGKDEVFSRVRFNEITKKAVLAAMDDGRRDRRPARRRAAGAPHHRPARRLRGVGPALEEDLARPLGRTRPDGRAADHLRARERDRGLRSGRVLDGRRDRSRARRRRRFTARLSTFDGEKLKFDGTDPRLPDEAAAAARARRRRRRDLDGRLGRDLRAPQEPGARRSSPPSSSRPRRAASDSPCAARCRSRSGSTRAARSRAAAPSA